MKKADKYRMLDEYQAGVTVTELGAKYGMRPSSVYQKVLDAALATGVGLRLAKFWVMRPRAVEIHARVVSGEKAALLAVEYGISRSRVMQIVKAEEERRRAGRAAGGVSGLPRQFDYDEALRLYQRGKSVEAIAAHLGRSKNTVWRAVRLRAFEKGVVLEPRERKVRS